jgi:hypothetical protein
VNVHASSRHGERVRSQGKAIYRTLLPALKETGAKAGAFVAINIETSEYVVADTRLDLMRTYQKRFGQAPGWVNRIDYDE